MSATNPFAKSSKIQRDNSANKDPVETVSTVSTPFSQVVTGSVPRLEVPVVPNLENVELPTVSTVPSEPVSDQPRRILRSGGPALLSQG